MKFSRVLRTHRQSVGGKDHAFLIEDGWDDYTFKTLFELVVFDRHGERIDIGPIKIMRRSMDGGRVDIPLHFDALPTEFCSLGQDQNYYEILHALAPEDTDAILIGLRDCVYRPAIFREFENEKAMTVSLLRTVDRAAISGTFAVALQGQAPLTPFLFNYTYPTGEHSEHHGVPTLRFAINPRTIPPTNIHVIIGRNGVGKTRLLSNLANALSEKSEPRRRKTYGIVTFEVSSGEPSSNRFANLVTIAFSAFDLFTPPQEDSVVGDIRCAYVGLKTWSSDNAKTRKEPTLKSIDELTDDFRDSWLKCVSGPRFHRWLDAVNILESDPGFRDLALSELDWDDRKATVQRVTQLFRTLSSGHKIVLLTTTKLVELVDERTLVLLDEPESHLHPPLLSSFIRALSTLLTRRNGAAIIATHSPVVLQETPKTCVWVIHRFGEAVNAERPSIETFGENVGVLTREVFGLEVTESGFHELIADEASNASSYEEMASRFNGQIGSEARAVALALLRQGKR